MAAFLGLHPGRDYTGGQRSPTLVDALPSGHPFSRLIRNGGKRWAHCTPHLRRERLRNVLPTLRRERLCLTRNYKTNLCVFCERRYNLLLQLMFHYLSFHEFC